MVGRGKREKRRKVKEKGKETQLRFHLNFAFYSTWCDDPDRVTPVNVSHPAFPLLSCSIPYFLLSPSYLSLSLLLSNLLEARRSRFLTLLL